MDPIQTLNVETAFLRIRDDILRGRLLPGEKVVAQKLAQDIGTSRTPVKEALARLEIEGLVVRAGNWGYSVRTISFRDAEELFEARLVVEVGNARLAAQRASEAEVEGMRRLLVESKRRLGAGALVEFQHRARGIHELIAQATGNAMLVKMFKQVNDLIILFGTSLLRANPQRARRILEENEAIVDAVASRRPEEAAALMREHIDRGHASFREAMSAVRPALRIL